MKAETPFSFKKLFFGTNPLVPHAKFCLFCALLPFLAVAFPEKAHSQQLLAYTVKRGDTLTEIAQRYQVSVTQLRRWNGIRDDKIIQGQQLQLWPLGAPPWYVVRSGESLSEVASQFDVSIATLRRKRSSPP